MELLKQLFPQVERVPREQCFHVVLAHRNLSSIPRDLIPVAKYVTVLDLSNNNISDVSFLNNFKNLEIIVLDHNKINSSIIFPKLPKLNTLWLNHNQIIKIVEFVVPLSKSCPKLEVLSLLGNEAAATNKSSSNYQEIYRFYVISELPRLTYLDDGPVTHEQRVEAEKMFEKPSVLNSLQVARSEIVKFVSFKQRNNHIV